MTSLEALLNEGENFVRRLTAKDQLDAIEEQLRASMVPIDITDPKAFAKACTGPGIYYIDAKFPFYNFARLEEFGDRWGRPRQANVPANTSRYYTARAKKHQLKIANGDFIPFYLGKEQNVQKRLNCHTNGLADSTTFSLKLNTRPEVVRGIEFRFGCAAIPVSDDAYFCVALLEKALRERMHPIVGRQ